MSPDALQGPLYGAAHSAPVVTWYSVSGLLRGNRAFFIIIFESIITHLDPFDIKESE